MIVDSSNGTTIITQQGESVETLAKSITEAYHTFKNNHIIVSLTGFNSLHLEDVLHLLFISNKHRVSKHSFVIVTDRFNLNETPDELIIVPTIQEANDIIEMEEMERDLGF